MQATRNPASDAAGRGQRIAKADASNSGEDLSAAKRLKNRKIEIQPIMDSVLVENRHGTSSEMTHWVFGQPIPSVFCARFATFCG
jgi:hypothetical protein